LYQNRNNYINQQKRIILTLSYDYYAEFDLQTLPFRTQTTVKKICFLIIHNSHPLKDQQEKSTEKRTFANKILQINPVETK
jgi:hypothetical protein